MAPERESSTHFHFQLYIKRGNWKIHASICQICPICGYLQRFPRLKHLDLSGNLPGREEDYITEVGFLHIDIFDNTNIQMHTLV